MLEDNNLFSISDGGITPVIEDIIVPNDVTIPEEVEKPPRIEEGYPKETTQDIASRVFHSGRDKTGARQIAAEILTLLNELTTDKKLPITQEQAVDIAICSVKAAYTWDLVRHTQRLHEATLDNLEDLSK